MSSVVTRARRLLAIAQDEYRGERAVLTGKIERELPQARVIADEIRRVFMSAMESVLARMDDDAFEKAKIRSLELQDKLSKLLVDNGHEPDALFDRPMCKLCADSGYVHSKPCECLRHYMAQVQLAELTALGGRTFDKFSLNVFSCETDAAWGLSQRDNMEGNLIYCRNWARAFSDSSPNLFLNGGTGQGKTYLCSCIANGVAEKGVDVKYVTAIKMFRDLEDRRFDRSAAEGDVRPYYESELLIIDDLGTEMTTAFVQSSLYDIINTRLIEGRKMIINANFTASELSRIYMPQICSRLLGEFKQLHFFGPDLRNN